MPDDFDRGFQIAVLDGRDIREVVVALRAVIVQPTHDVEYTLGAHVDVRHAPHDFDALDRVPELLAQRGCCRVRLAAAIGNVAWRDRCRGWVA